VSTRIKPGATAACVAIVLLVGAVYFSAPQGSFHFDDLLNITENPVVRMHELSTESLVRAATESPVNPRRGLAYVSFALDWWRGEGAAGAFLWTNLVLHAANAVLVYMLFLVVLRDGLPGIDGRTIAAAFCGAAIWAVHPIQVQAVAYIVQRMAQLSCLFTLIAVLAYILARRSRRPARRWALLALSVGSMVGGALSKENAYIAPLLLGLTELGVLRRDGPMFHSRSERIAAALAAVVAMSAVGTAAAGIGPLARFFDYSARDFTMLERGLTQPRVVLFHAGQLLWPWPDRFGVEHDFDVSTSLLHPPGTLAAALAVAIWCAAGLFLLSRRNRRSVGFWMLWPPVTLLIESSLVPLEMIFEHRMYLPTVGLAGLAVTLVSGYARNRRCAIPALVSAAMIIGLLATSTVARVAVWRTPLSLAEDAVRSAPSSSRAWSRLGLAHLRNREVDLAERDFRHALELDPDNVWALEYVGVILMDRGELELARTTLARALTLPPRRPTLANHHGEVLLAQGRHAEAERWFARAISTRSWVAAYHWNRALALEALNRCAEARAEWNEYLTLETEPAERETVRRHLSETACHDPDPEG